MEEEPFFSGVFSTSFYETTTKCIPDEVIYSEYFDFLQIKLTSAHFRFAEVQFHLSDKQDKELYGDFGIYRRWVNLCLHQLVVEKDEG